jgi:hypothetical protein
MTNDDRQKARAIFGALKTDAESANRFEAVKED